MCSSCRRTAVVAGAAAAVGDGGDVADASAVAVLVDWVARGVAAFAGRANAVAVAAAVADGVVAGDASAAVADAVGGAAAAVAVAAAAA